MNCRGRKKKLGKKSYKVKCSGGCNVWFHATLKYADITDDVLKNIETQKIEWICNDCEDKGDVELSEDEVGTDETSSEIVELERDSKQKRESKKVDDVLKRLQNQIEQNKRLLNKIYKQDKERSTIEKEIKELKLDNNQLKSEIRELKKNSMALQQDPLENNIIISGLPLSNKDDTNELKKVIIDIGRLVDVDILEEDFSYSRMISKPIKELKVAFNSLKKKEELMKAIKKNTITLRSLGYDKNGIIFINHDMTRKNRRLYKLARDFRKSSGYKFAWFSSGKVFLRENINSKVIHVESKVTIKNLSKS